PEEDTGAAAEAPAAISWRITSAGMLVRINMGIQPRQRPGGLQACNRSSVDSVAMPQEGS
ncbi:MAG TPA: hypothetical protein DCE43_11235, partial [Planctomycetaceae bacterium]|nr:hypothetical protein [Planctomycetaceae bacterium]